MDNRGRGRGRGGGRGGGGGEFRGGGGGGDRGGRGGFQGGRGGRGDFHGGRGGGDFQGGRGGRGDFHGGRGGGDFQGGRGRGGGDFQGGRGRGGGDFHGGRGRGGGDFHGGRGGRGGGDFHGDRGRGGYGGGGFRGGRGGGGGGYGGPEVDVFRGPGPSIPQPDPKITALEDSWIKEHSTDIISKVGKLSVSSEFFPTRPNFGTAGTEVILWANYFKMNVKAETQLFKYMLKITDKRLTRAQDEKKKEEESTKKQGPKGKGKQAQAGEGSKETKEAKGKKLTKLIQLALGKLPPAVPIATEFKAQLISTQKFELPEDDIIEIDLEESDRKPEKWFVRFDGPLSMNISGLMEYLQTLDDKGNDAVFPKYPDEIDALGVILGHTARSNPKTAAVGRNRFFATDADRMDAGVMPPGSLLTILRGYVQSVRPATGRLLLNTNVTHGVFRRPIPLARLFEEFRHVEIHLEQNHTPKAAADLTRLHKFLARSRIQCRVPGDKPGQFVTIERSIAGLATVKDGAEEKRRPEFRYSKFPFATPSTARFYLGEPKTPRPQVGNLAYGQMVMVQQYYQQKYNISARVGLPLINAGTTGRPIYFLAELCELLPGQPMKSKLSGQEQDAMVKFACRAPPKNALSITTSARELLALDNNNLLTKFSVSVDKDLITVKGRELTPPLLAYRSPGQSVTPDNGGWLMKFVKVCQSGRIGSWTYLSIEKYADNDGVIKATVGKFAGFMSDKMGISIPKQPNPPAGIKTGVPQSEDQLRAAFVQLQKLPKRPDFVLVVLPFKDTALYNMVKKLADVDFGFQTVCVVQEKLLQVKGQDGYFANVALKVNLKFGGVNHSIKDTSAINGDKTMYVGYDVTHPTNLAPGAGDNAPSIVGLVASMDAGLAQWPAVAWQNPPRQEMVNDKGKFSQHFKSRLEMWRRKNNRLPENIVIFRDGVSEGQFKKVLDEEVPHIREACSKLYTQKQPRLALIVSVKRHQTRFYPTDAGHIHPRSKSPKEGTVVDRGVTNVRYWDFFLQAHASLQGTARPAHYTVLLDEIFRADYKDKAANVLEKLTHDMCYLYGRATKAVSICPPAYYADLVCTRARIHQSELFDDVRSITSGEHATVSGRTVHNNLKDTMYYI